MVSTFYYESQLLLNSWLHMKTAITCNILRQEGNLICFVLAGLKFDKLEQVLSSIPKHQPWNGSHRHLSGEVFVL